MSRLGQRSSSSEVTAKAHKHRRRRTHPTDFSTRTTKVVASYCSRYFTTVMVRGVRDKFLNHASDEFCQLLSSAGPQVSKADTLRCRLLSNEPTHRQVSAQCAPCQPQSPSSAITYLLTYGRTTNRIAHQRSRPYRLRAA